MAILSSRYYHLAMLARSLAAIFLATLLLGPVALAQDPPCTHANTDGMPPLDIQKVQDTWLQWINRVRTRQKLPALKLNPFLNASAMNWSLRAKGRGTIDHKRYDGSPYYDYKASEQWFRDRGLTFQNVGGITFTENIGWGVVSCPKDDCTQKMISAIRSTYNFFMAERTKKYRPHWNSIIQKNFREIGVGFAYSKDQHRYYLTIHYATAITSTPPPLCSLTSRN
jgi:uncharacterized protein YkwD